MQELSKFLALRAWANVEKGKLVMVRYTIDEFRFRCPLDRCAKAYDILTELRNHVLDHHPFYERSFSLFQRVKVVDDQASYVILYEDSEMDTFLLRFSSADCTGKYNHKYVSSSKIMAVMQVQEKDIIAFETGTLPTQIGYLDSLKLAVVCETTANHDGNISWLIQFIRNDEWVAWRLVSCLIE